MLFSLRTLLAHQPVRRFVIKYLDSILGTSGLIRPDESFDTYR